MITPDMSHRLRDDELNAPERRLIRTAAAGALLDLGDSGDDRAVRAELLVELLSGERPSQNGRVRAVKLRGARITGVLDLEATEVVCPLLLADCRFEEPVSLREAAVPALYLPGCQVPGLAAEQLRTAGNLELNHGFTADGEVTLLGARVGGKLSLSGARLVNPGGRALNADRLTVEQGMFCREGFTAEGEVRLLGARITGQLDLSRACLSNPGGKALQANWLTVEQYMLCTEGFTTDGEISLSGAQLAHLDLSGTCLTNRDGRTVNGYGLSVTQDIVCRDGFASEGQINLAGARVGGRLALDGARLVNPNGQVLSAPGSPSTVI